MTKGIENLEKVYYQTAWVLNGAVWADLCSEVKLAQIMLKQSRGFWKGTSNPPAVRKKLPKTITAFKELLVSISTTADPKSESKGNCSVEKGQASSRLRLKTAHQSQCPTTSCMPEQSSSAQGCSSCPEHHWQTCAQTGGPWERAARCLSSVACCPVGQVWTSGLRPWEQQRTSVWHACSGYHPTKLGHFHGRPYTRCLHFCCSDAPSTGATGRRHVAWRRGNINNFYCRTFTSLRANNVVTMFTNFWHFSVTFDLEILLLGYLLNSKPLENKPSLPCKRDPWSQWLNKG